jgi:hypothetical protein
MLTKQYWIGQKSYMYIYCLPIYIPFLLGMVDGDWEVFINNQLKSMTHFFIVFCLQQQAMLWMRGHVVLIE